MLHTRDVHLIKGSTDINQKGTGMEESGLNVVFYKLIAGLKTKTNVPLNIVVKFSVSKMSGAQCLQDWRLHSKAYK